MSLIRRVVTQMDTVKQIIDLEIRLHKKEARINQPSLCDLLHPGFYEIGYSGSTYSYKDAIAWLGSAGEPSTEIWSQDFECTEVAEGVVLLLYHSAEVAEDGSLKRPARRSSIWQNDAGHWQLRFHQATPVEAFTKREL